MEWLSEIPWYAWASLFTVGVPLTCAILYLSERETDQRIIMRLLLTGGESYGIDLIKASSGTLSRGSIYLTLGEMEEIGYISSRKIREESNISSKRLYKATVAGKRWYYEGGIG